MDIFKKTRKDELEFDKFIDKLDMVYNNLREFEKEIDIFDISSIKKSFIAKTDDFFREDRKLNIGIIGRVKAGKSSFLNAMLFDGKPILPAAVTPKTATLIRIEYDEENKIEVEYYSVNEWKEIEKNAMVQSELKEFQVAREIVKLVKERALDPYEFVGKDKAVITYGNYDVLMQSINDYTGENGRYTPLVKSVSIYIDKEELEGISIVDTPGLYDPVVSRVDKTKQFMELCDVVFFLSKSTTFLDRNDIDLLASQLPKKGVKKLVLVCSRFDDGIRDTLWKTGSLLTSIEETKQKLMDYTESAFNNYKRTNYYINSEMLNQCKVPVFVSSMAHNMSLKAVSEYNEKEMKVYNDLNINGELTADLLKQIGNFDEINAIYETVLEDKEEMLEEKAASFIPTAQDELRDKLRRIESLAEKRIAQLHNYDREKLLEQKKQISLQINKMKSSIEEIFNETCNKIEDNKIDAIREIRVYNREYLQVSEKEGVETHYEIRKVSTTSWFKPWTWGTSTREIYSYDEKYKYIDMYDAIDNIRNYVRDGVDCISKIFNRSLDVALLKYKLINVVIENLDVSNDKHDAEYYKLLVEKTLQNIKIPAIVFSTTSFENSITSQFSGEVKGNSMKANLRAKLSEAIYGVGEEMCKRLEDEVVKFRDNMNGAKEEFINSLLKEVNSELNTVIAQFENKENEIERYNMLITKIRRLDMED
ncbi:MAG: dynamin family protein [Lachnospiraceae bacterium]|nr:dynamin family protein [Lachnospiraceae bacterium]